MKHTLTIFLAFTMSAGIAQKSTSGKLPDPYATKSSTNFCKVIGWNNKMPLAPKGFKVERYADGFNNPRWMYVLPNGDVLVAETNKDHTVVEQVGGTVIGAAKSIDIGKSENRITLFRDTNKDGKPDMRETFLTRLNQPFGMLLIGNWFYVANTDGLMRYPYKEGQTSITAEAEKIAELPAGKTNRHWTRNIISNEDGSKIYIAVGSASNVAENGMNEEILRADILEVNPDGTDLKVYASGLRNPVGMAWAPGTKTLWTAVNERDELGDDLVPDYLTSVKEGGFYGWPYSYWGKHVDPRMKESRPDLVEKAIVPEVDLGSHTASLGLAFYTDKKFPAKYHNGAFVAQHGSWNRSVPSGYKVVFVPFKDGKPVGPPEDFLTGFLADEKKNEAYGRPVGVTQLPDGSLLVTDDVSNVVWRVSYQNK
jgi:glucose/arabinose dehydrogenase